MEKDIKNAAITFSLIAIMLYGGSFAYGKKILAEENENQRILEQEQQAQKEEVARQLQLQKFKEEEDRIQAEERLNQDLVRLEEAKLQAQVDATAMENQSAFQFKEALAKQQGIYDAQQKANADLLAKQKAEQLKAAQVAADALAQQVAAQKAIDAAKVTVKKTSRKSRAS